MVIVWVRDGDEDVVVKVLMFLDISKKRCRFEKRRMGMRLRERGEGEGSTGHGSSFTSYNFLVCSLFER